MHCRMEKEGEGKERWNRGKQGRVRKVQPKNKSLSMQTHTHTQNYAIRDGKKERKEGKEKVEGTSISR